MAPVPVLRSGPSAVGQRPRTSAKAQRAGTGRRGNHGGGVGSNNGPQGLRSKSLEAGSLDLPKYDALPEPQRCVARPVWCRGSGWATAFLLRKAIDLSPDVGRLNQAGKASRQRCAGHADMGVQAPRRHGVFESSATWPQPAQAGVGSLWSAKDQAGQRAHGLKKRLAKLSITGRERGRRQALSNTTPRLGLMDRGKQIGRPPITRLFVA